MKQLFVLNGGAQIKPGNRSAFLTPTTIKSLLEERRSINFGNALVFDAILKTLRYDVIRNLQFADAANEALWPPLDYDATVVRGANYLNEKLNLGHVVPLLRRLKGPIVALGVGAQAPDYRKLALRPGTIEAIRIIAGKCTSLGVRGVYSAEILNDLGIKNLRLIGCPSFYRSLAPSLTLRKVAQPDTARVAITLNRHLSQDYASNAIKANRIQRALILAAAVRPSSRVFSQGEYEETAVVLGSGEERRKHLEPILRKFGLEGSATAEDLFLNRMSAIFDVDSWADEVARNIDVMMGFRLHGSVIALHQGVPAVFFTYDSRTREMADLFAVPSIETDDFMPPDVDAIVSQMDFTATEQAYRRNFAEYRRFLDENGLCHALPAPVSDVLGTPVAHPNKLPTTQADADVVRWLHAEIDYLTGRITEAERRS